MYVTSLVRRGVVCSKKILGSNVRHHNADSSKKLLELLAAMPKANSARILVSQKQRQQIATKAQKYGPSTVYLQVLGSGARGAPNTLYLFTDQRRYIFNCGECTQRLAHEHKVKLSRLDNIFITSKTWRNIGGLPGLSLTLQDYGVPHITLHGPKGLDELYTATKRFVIMKDMNVTMAKCSPSEDFEDNVMSVKYVILSDKEASLLHDLKPPSKKQKLTESIEKELEAFMYDNTDYYKAETRNSVRSPKKTTPKSDCRDKRTSPLHRSPSPEHRRKVENLFTDTPQDNCTVAYICTLKKRLGTLDLAKCVEKGVKPGPLLGLLKSGQNVVLHDGTIVLSKDVKTPDDPGPVFIVLEVPNINYLKPSEFSAHFDDGKNPPENIPTVIVHYTPPDVFRHSEYQEFISLFGPTTKHLIINEQNSCLGSEAVHKTQHKLHLLDNDIFPLLKDLSIPAVWNAQPPVAKTDSPLRLKGMEELKNKIAIAQFQNLINADNSMDKHSNEQATLEFIAARTLTMFHLRPKKQLDRSAEPKLHIQQYLQETMDVDGFVASLEQFRRLVESMRYTNDAVTQEYPKVVFLGTGSCIPSKTRNTSAIVVHIDEHRSLLFDCGEGTYGQLVRFYGPKRVNSFLRSLKAIFISHLHADHHIGLIGVLQARRQAFENLPDATVEPVFLLAPGQIMCWLTMYDQQFENIRSDFCIIPNQNLITERQTPTDLTAASLANIGIRRIQTCLVPHCPNAFGVAVEVGKYKITYSGDTLPCESLVLIGQNSTLLIHEATMEDELADEARIKMHSTTTQAIEVGKAMNAKYTVLTHFSQRYARLPRLNANILNDNKSVGIAFDNMQITMSDLCLLPHMYAPLQLMFAEHCVELELKAAQRAQKKGSTLSSNSPSVVSTRLRSCTSPLESTSIHTEPSRTNDLTRHTEVELAAIQEKLKRTLSPLRSRSNKETANKSNTKKESIEQGRTNIVTKLINHSGSPNRASASENQSDLSRHKEVELAAIEGKMKRTLSPLRSRSNQETANKSNNKKESIEQGRTGIVTKLINHSGSPNRASASEIQSGPVFCAMSKSGDFTFTGRSSASPSRILEHSSRPTSLASSETTSPRTVVIDSSSQCNSTKKRMMLAEDKHIERRKQAEKNNEKMLSSCFMDKTTPTLPSAYTRNQKLANTAMATKRVISLKSDFLANMATVPIQKTSRTSCTSSSGRSAEKSLCNSTIEVKEKITSKLPNKRANDTAKIRGWNGAVNVNHDATCRSPTSFMLQRWEKRVPSPVNNLSIPAARHSIRAYTVYSTSPKKSRSPSDSSCKSNGLRPQPIQNTRNYLKKLDNMGKEGKPSSDTINYKSTGSNNLKTQYARNLSQKGDNRENEEKAVSEISYNSNESRPQLQCTRRSLQKLENVGKSKKSESEPRLQNNKRKSLLTGRPASKIPDVLKPRQLNEDERRQELQKAKEKFTSKRYWNDSKYERIEGLNWISWK